MRKTLTILIVLMLLISTGCSKKEVIEHNYVYRGENERWVAEYIVDGTGTFRDKDGTLAYESQSYSLLTVTYKNDISELKLVKNLGISYKSTAGFGKRTMNFEKDPLNEKVYKMESRSNGGAIESKDEIIKVSIDIDGKVEIIELKNVE